MQNVEATARTLLAKFKQACAGLGVNPIKIASSGNELLDYLAGELAQNQTYRILLGEEPSLWVDLRRLWRDITRLQLTFWNAADSDEEARREEEDRQSGLQKWLISLSKFTRNLVAGSQPNQNRAFENEPDIRKLLHYYTSWSAMEDTESLVIARLLTQTLSNLITGNDDLISKLWSTYLSLPEDQVVLIRLLGSQDEHALFTTFVFLLNCIHEKQGRVEKLIRTSNGIRICVSVLDDMVKLHDAQEGTAGAQAFDVGYNIICQIIEGSMVSELLQAFNIPGEIITPHQTTLLKLVDSYLQSTPLDGPSIADSLILKIHLNLRAALATTFFSLASYAQSSIKKSLGYDPAQLRTSPYNGGSSQQTARQDTLVPAELDMVLPKACEALILVAQCITTIALQAEEHRAKLTECNGKDYFNGARSSRRGLAENIIELLRLLDLFLPKIHFGRPVKQPSTPSYLTAPPDTSGFNYLKRDLVRLLGVLCFQDRGVQDIVRECDGIKVVMTMCVIDESNPYLQEHAVFTLHNLLEDNKDNQEVVNSIKPVTPIKGDGQ